MFPKNKLVLFALICCFSFSVYAQDALKKGVYTAGGSVVFSSDKFEYENSEYSKYMTVDIAPSFSYFIIDNLLVGGFISFAYYEDEYSYGDGVRKYVSRHFDIGPAVRYYIGSSVIVPFVGAEGMYTFYLGEDETAFKWALEGGANYFIASNAAIEPFVRYESGTYSDSESTLKNISFGVRMNYYILD